MKKKLKKEEVNHHFFFVEVPVDIVGPEAMLWGESDWWPKDSISQYTRVTEGNIQIGTIYKQKVLKPLTPSWKVEVTDYKPNQFIERAFVTGMFRGYDIVKVEERVNGTRVDYELHYHVRGLLNKLLWPSLYRHHHDQNIEKVMSALKDFVIKKYENQQKDETVIT